MQDDGPEEPDAISGQKPDEPPGAVSDQNAEEAESEHAEGDGMHRRKPAPDEERQEGGEAGEGSQSTGHPESAG
jgi:hypothetical protein